jgi:hypothetical protein
VSTESDPPPPREPAPAAAGASRPAAPGSPGPRRGFAAALRGYGPIGLVAILVIMFSGAPWLGGLLALGWARVTGTPLRDIGFARPRRWLADAALGIVLGVAR